MEKFPSKYLQGNSAGTGLHKGQRIAILLWFILEKKSLPQELLVRIRAVYILFL